MAIDYNSILNSEQKAQILNNRLSQLIIEGYQNSIGLKTAKVLENQEQIDQIEEVLKIIEASIIMHKQELDTVLAEGSKEKSEEKSE